MGAPAKARGRPQVRDAGATKRAVRLLVAGFAALAVLVVGLAYWAWLEQARAIRASAEGSLVAIAGLKADQISVWLGEQHSDAEVVRGDPLLAAAVADLLAGRGGAATEEDIRALLADLQEHHDFVDVLLVDRDGRIVVRQPEDAAHAPGAEVRALARTTLRTGRVEMTDLYLDAAGEARIEMAAPVLADEAGDPPIAVVVMHIDPHDYLFPLIQEWPLESASGETLLVQRRGDEAVFLNELRHRKGTTLRLGSPLSDPDLPAAMAVRGVTGIVEGVDYRGVPVIAALEPVPDAPWYIVAKTDSAEVVGPIESRAWMTAGFTFLVVALAAAGTLLLWRARESQVTSQLVASEVRFRSLFENMAEGVAMHEIVRDSQGEAVDYRILDTNPAYSTQTGLPAEQMHDRLATDAYETAEAPYLDLYGRTVEEQAPRRFESYFEPLGRQFQVSVVPQGDDRFATIFEDITDRVVRERELRETRDYLESLIDYANAPVIVWDTDLRITRFNHAFEELTQRAADEVVGRQLELLFPDDERRTQALGHVTSATSGEHWQVIEIPILRADGEVRTVLWNSATVYEADGVTPIATIAQGQDITERERAEKEIEHLNAELEQRVFDRTAELDAANKELEAFAYSVSHDLRAPLRHVSGFSALLAERTGDDLDERGRHYVERISTAVREMGVLIDDLLQFSRTGRAELKIEPVDMDAVLAEALEPLRHETDGREIEWRVARLGGVVADRALLRQVWANLLGNAVKYTRGRTPARIEVGVIDPGPGENGDAFFVRDNGVGFDMQYSHKLFGVFQRLHSSGEFEGTGIGLANVHRIVTRLGGRVWAESAPDEGAAFCFSLPRRKETTS